MPDTPAKAGPSADQSKRRTTSAPTTKAGTARRARLLEVSANLFADNGFRATTVRDIADAAGVLSGSIYYHFPSKEAILDELIGSYLQELLIDYQAAVEEETDPAAILRRFIDAAFRSMDSHRAAIIVIQQERGVLAELPQLAHNSVLEEQSEKLWLDTIEGGINSGAFRSDVSARVALRLIRDATFLAARWYRPDGALPAAHFAQQYAQLLLGGLQSSR